MPTIFRARTTPDIGKAVRGASPILMGGVLLGLVIISLMASAFSVAISG